MLLEILKLERHTKDPSNFFHKTRNFAFFIKCPCFEISQILIWIQVFIKEGPVKKCFMEAFYFICIQFLNAHIYICSCLLKNYIIFDFAFRIFDQFNFIKKETCACINPLEKCWQILLQQICNIVHFQLLYFGYVSSRYHYPQLVLLSFM